MNLNAELAAAARWVRAATERLPAEHRPDVAAEWGRLMDEVERSRSEGAAELAIIEWRATMSRQLGGRR